jgi:hypothetical protein
MGVEPGAGAGTGTGFTGTPRLEPGEDRMNRIYRIPSPQDSIATNTNRFYPVNPSSTF